MSRARPERFAALFERARTSRAAAVKAFCLECVGFARVDITRCTATHCPLHPHRPYQRDDEPDDEVTA